MAAQVSLSELANQTRVNTRNGAEKNARTAFGEYPDAQKLKADNFADIYHDKLVERQALLALRARSDSHAARSRSVSVSAGTDWAERKERAERAERAEKTGWTERTERSDKGQRPERLDSGDWRDSQSADRDTVRTANNDDSSAAVAENSAATSRNGENLPARKNAEGQDNTESAATDNPDNDLKSTDSGHAVGETDEEYSQQTAEDTSTADLIAPSHVTAEQLAGSQKPGDGDLTQDQPLQSGDLMSAEDAVTDSNESGPQLVGPGVSGASTANSSNDVKAMTDLSSSAKGQGAALAASQTSAEVLENKVTEGQVKASLSARGISEAEQLTPISGQSQQGLQAESNLMNSALTVSDKVASVGSQATQDSSLSRNMPANGELTSSVLGKALSGEGEAEVTQQFKELSTKFPKAGQQNLISGNLVNPEITGAEKSEVLRGSHLEAIFQDKTSISLPPSVAVRSSTPSLLPQGAYITNLQMPAQSPEWQQGMAQKLLWFVSEKIQSAKIHINPPELGPVEMKIQVSKDQAQIQIQSQHVVIRDLLEGTAQRLREMMAAQGIELTDFDVGSQGQQAGSDGGTKANEQHADGTAAAGADHDILTTTENVALDQLVDYYV